MSRIAARLLILFLPASFVPLLSAQETAHVQPAKARSATTPAGSAKVSPNAQLLFGSLAVNTRSIEARKHLETALNRYENADFNTAIAEAQKSTQLDPNFALGYAVWSFVARRTNPMPAAAAKAQSLAPKAAPDEKLLVTFLVGAQDANVLPAISAMNDLLARRLKDKHVLYLTSEWLFFQQDFQRAMKLMEQSLDVDPDFAPSLNMLGYANVQCSDPNPQAAIKYLRRYADVLPGEANAQDSLGEVLRITGDDSGSLAHYAQALDINPNFITSQYGRGDTYTLMGDFGHARSEYDKALKMATNPHDELHVRFQLAMVNYWEGNTNEGRQQLSSLLEKATKANDAEAAFEIGFARALLAADAAEALAQLKSLESLLQNAQTTMTEAERNTDLAQVLREEVRISSAIRKPADAQAALQALEKLALASRDQNVQNTYESAQGYVALDKGDFTSAARQFEADLQSPLTMKQYILAATKSKNTHEAEAARARMKFLRAPTAEWFAATHANGIAAQLATP